MYACDIIFVATSDAGGVFVVVSSFFSYSIHYSQSTVCVCHEKNISADHLLQHVLLVILVVLPAFIRLPLAFAMAKPSDLLFETYFSNSIDSFY